MTAKELIVRARNAEEEAKKKEVLMTKSVEKLKQAEEKRQEKGFEMKKIEREFEVNIFSRLFMSASTIWKSSTINDLVMKSFLKGRAVGAKAHA